MSLQTLPPIESQAEAQQLAQRSARVVEPDPESLAKAFELKQRKSFQWRVKRSIDIIGSSAGLFFLAPFLLLFAMLIRVETPGPALFKQKRLGLHGREFEMYKFRSMRQDADKEMDELQSRNQTNDGMFKLFDDPRVTRIGRFIRKYSIDELPQLINVLKGDMSLVGPRPPIQRELQHYKKWHHVRFATVPGLTGLWQVSGRSSIQKFDDVVRLDYQYISNWNLLLDLKLLLKTVPVVLLGKDTA